MNAAVPYADVAALPNSFSSNQLSTLRPSNDVSAPTRATPAKYWEQVFGRISPEQTFSEIAPRKDYQFNLPRYYQEKSELLSKVYIMATALTDTVLITEIAPVVRTNNIHLHFREITFHPQMAETLAERSMARLFAKSDTSYRLSLHRKLVNHVVDAEYAVTEDGRDDIARIIYQMGLAFAETAAMEVLLAIEEHDNILQAYEKARREDEGFMRLTDLINQEVAGFDCVKEPKDEADGKLIYRLRACIDEYSRRFPGINFDTILTAMGVMAHMQIDNPLTDYSKSGPNGPRSLEQGAFSLTTKAGFRFVAPTATRENTILTDDLMASEVEIGEAVVLPAPTSVYNSLSRSIIIRDMFTGLEKKITVNDVVKHSGIFMHNGEGPLKNFYVHDDEGAVGGRYADDVTERDFTEEDLAGVPLTRKAPNVAELDQRSRYKHLIAFNEANEAHKKKYTPVRFIGEMPESALSIEDIDLIVAATLGHISNEEQSRVSSAITEARRIVEMTNAIPANKAQQFILLTVASSVHSGDTINLGSVGSTNCYPSLKTGRDLIWPNHGIPMPFVVTPSLDALREDGHHAFFPGYQHGAGFRAITQYYRSGMLNVKGLEYMKDTLETVARVTETLQAFTRRISDFFPGTLAANKRVALNVIDDADAFDTLFNLVVAPDTIQVLLPCTYNEANKEVRFVDKVDNTTPHYRIPFVFGRRQAESAKKGDTSNTYFVDKNAYYDNHYSALRAAQEAVAKASEDYNANKDDATKTALINASNTLDALQRAFVGKVKTTERASKHALPVAMSVDPYVPHDDDHPLIPNPETSVEDGVAENLRRAPSFIRNLFGWFMHYQANPADNVQRVRASAHTLSKLVWKGDNTEITTSASLNDALKNFGGDAILLTRLATSQPLLSRFDAIFESSSGSLLRIAIAFALLLTPVTGQACRLMQNNGVPSPIGWVVVSPHMQYIAKQIVIMQAGRRTMATYVKEGKSSIGYDAKLRVIYFSASLHTAAHIHNKKAVVRLPHACVTKYIRGASTEWWSDNDFEHYRPGTDPDPMNDRRSLLALPLRMTEEPGDLLVLPGKLELSTISHTYCLHDVDQPKKLQYSSAPIMCCLADFLGPARRARGNRDSMVVNQLCLRATHMAVDPLTQSFVLKRGNSHFADKWLKQERVLTPLMSSSIA